MPEQTVGHSKTLVRIWFPVGLDSNRYHFTSDTLVSTLEVQSFLCVDTDTGRWKIGVSGFRMGNAFLRSRDFVA